MQPIGSPREWPEVAVPEAPDGIAIIGADSEHEGRFLEHYFDSRGVARSPGG